MNFMKRDCHRMMRIMFKDNRKAYIWLKENIGDDIHFSEDIPLELLKEIHTKLYQRMIRKGFDY